MRTSIFALLLTALFVAGCGPAPADNTVNTNAVSGPAGDGSSGPLTSEPGTPTPTAKPTEPPADDIADFEGTAGNTEKKNPDITGVAVMSEVRSARHGNYDRVVFEFLGNEMPTYHIEYIDKPVRACGSGDVVPLAGDGWLEVRFSDARAHTPEGQPTIEDRSRSPNLPIVKDLKITCDFESEVTWVMGVASPNRYRVIELKDPVRLAVDIKH
jgi:hypothetical protein